MEQLYYPITVDIYDKHLPPIIHAKQDDSARGVAITVTRQGAPYTLPTGCTYIVRVRKADNKPVVLSARVSSNTIYADFTAQTLAAPGQAVADAAIYDSGGKLLSTFIFAIEVEQAAANTTEISSSEEYDALGRLLADLIAAEAARSTAEAARASAESTRQSQETARQTAESGRASAESTRSSNENTRKNNETARQTAESGRASAESTRATQEAARVNAESSRTSAEAARASAESTRQSQEATRQSQETARSTAESGRATAESNRITAEAARVREYNTIMATFAEAIDNINAATEAAAVVQEIYENIEISLGYDDDGDVCAVYKE